MTAATMTATTPARPFGLIRHSAALSVRSLIKTMRTPEQLLDVTLQPVIFVVMFVYLLGGAISGSQKDYLQFLLPAIMVQTLMFASVATGVSLNTDIKKGVFDRFRSLPIGRSAPLVGSVLGDVVRFVVSIVVLLTFGYADRLPRHHRPAVGTGRVPAGDPVRVRVQLGVRADRRAHAGARRGAGHGVRGAVPADLRHQHDGADRHAARLAPGLGAREPGGRP